jgi:hypothetical protein
VEDVRKTAHGMVVEAPEPPEPEPQPGELVVTIKIDVPSGVVVKIEQTES